MNFYKHPSKDIQKILDYKPVKNYQINAKTKKGLFKTPKLLNNLIKRVTCK